MSALQNKIDFVALIAVDRANPNGDPLGGNRPRTDTSGFGEMTSNCIKRKIRNRMNDLGHPVFVLGTDRSTDGFDNLSDRAKPVIKDEKNPGEKACQAWLDVRSFGQVFAFADAQGVSLGVRGPVTIHDAVSVSPVEVESFQITKCVNGSDPNKDKEKSKKTDSDAKSEKKSQISSDRMGSKHRIHFGMYVLKGAINVQLAEKTGFTEEDAKIIKECLRTLFVNDASSARPEGSMEVLKLFWFEHNSKSGQYSSAKVHRSIRVEQKDPLAIPTCVDDYKITVNELPGLTPEIIEGL